MVRFILAVLVFYTSATSAQMNYVLNPDFEQHTACPTNFDQIRLTKYWSGIDSSSINGSCTPDYCHMCAANISSVNVPFGKCYWQYPNSGSGFAHVLITVITTIPSDDVRNYLQGRLYKKLTAGKSYCFSMYVNLSESAYQAIADIGVYFDNGSIDTTHNCGAAQTKYIPQVVNTLGIITDTANWIKIEGSFIANGTEQFLTIGNFKDNAHTTYTNMPYNSYTGTCAGTVILIDDVSVIESDLSADAGLDRHIGKEDSTYIGRPKEVGLECTWTVLGSSTVIGTGAGLWVKPSVTTSYVVTQTLCGATKKDTVRVEVWGVGVNSIFGQAQEYGISPNPSNGHTELSQSVADPRPAFVSIYEMTGKSILEREVLFNDRHSMQDLSALAPGLYFMQIRDADGSIYKLRFVKE